jgi:2-dehydro-3-deoxyphosphogluconate aldolase/(4S)-4-hydroxy-2-oxoglutarate aldolase
MIDVTAFHAGLGVVPVIVIDDSAHAERLAQALTSGGLPSGEVTLRTPAALDAIREMAQVPGFVAGAGTVVHPSQVEPAMTAGAQYIVSPGFGPAVSRECAALGVLLIPGVATATEVQAARDVGCSVLKFFPAEAAGGARMVAALSAPFADTRFVPTGGIGLGNLQEYLDVPSVLAVGGTWIAPQALIRSGAFDQIAGLATEAATRAKEIRCHSI